MGVVDSELLSYYDALISKDYYLSDIRLPSLLTMIMELFQPFTCEHYHTESWIRRRHHVRCVRAPDSDPDELPYEKTKLSPVSLEANESSWTCLAAPLASVCNIGTDMLGETCTTFAILLTVVRRGVEST